MEKTHQTKQDKEKSYTERSESVVKDREVLQAKGTIGYSQRYFIIFIVVYVYYFKCF